MLKKMGILFRNTPLNETILGLQFNDTIFGPVMSSNMLFEIISVLKSEYDRISEHPPLPSIIESRDKDRREMILKDFVSRKHFLHHQKHKLIQMQPDRLLFNWRKMDDHSVYPKYDTLFADFYHIIQLISEKSKVNLLEKVNQYEFTYIDHVYIDSFGLENYDVSEVFSIFPYGKAVKNFTINYAIPEDNIGGVLDVSIRTAKHKQNNRKLFVIENTCRGFSSGKTISTWFDEAHTILQENFLRIITDKSKEIWGYEEK